ncbi:TPA_asm: L [Begonia betacytorhabdovirus 1]|nr:TPA_asm: L [Begonia betacytorhabdovirus 1]
MDYDTFESLVEEFGVQATPGLGDFHLRSAITPINLKEISKGNARKNTITAFRTLRISCGDDIIEGVPAKLLAHIFIDEMTSDMNDLPPVKIDQLQRVVKAAARAFKRENGFDCPLELIAKKLDEYDTSNTYLGNIGFSRYEEGSKFYNLLLIISNGLVSGRQLHDASKIIGKMNNGSFYTVSRIKTQYILAGELFAVKVSGESHYKIFSLDVLRMITDKISERANILFISSLFSDIDPEIYLPDLDIMSLFNYGDLMLRKYGNKAYKLIKFHEPFCWGSLLSAHPEDICNNTIFLQSMREAAYEDFENGDVDQYIHTIQSICKTPHHFSQIAGLFREWGHPEVDMLTGFNQVRDIGTAVKFESNVIPEIAGRKAKEIFFMKYYKINSHYPNYVLAETVNFDDHYLAESLRSQTMINTKSSSYSLVLWDDITIQQTIPIPTTMNLSLIVADTAISPTREEILNSKSGKDTLSPHIRRGVLKFIKDGVINCRELLEGIENNPEGLDKNYKIIGLYPKEREINPKARMFSLMSLMLRAYIVVTEEMLSGLIKYFPGITMTDDLLSLTKKMLSYSRGQSESKLGEIVVVINSDFEKWNLNMRFWATFYVFKMLGDIYGLPSLFNKTYQIFETCIMYLADGSFLPHINEFLDLVENQIFAYTGHKGGLEGLRQKGWTIFTVVLIAYICDKLKIKYQLMGQGDNQLIILYLFSESERRQGYRSLETIEEYRALLNIFMREFVETFELVGLPIKKSETWVSQNLFLYGKVPLFRGVTLANSYKRLARIFPFSNEDLMTVDNAMSAISANAITASGCDLTPYPSFVLAKWQQIKCCHMFLRYHPLKGSESLDFSKVPKFFLNQLGIRQTFTVKSPISKDDLVLSMVESFKTLGGTNGISLYHLILRGFPDGHSRDMHYLMTAFDANKIDDPKISGIYNNWVKIYLSKDVDRSRLLEDPTSLNLLVPAQTLSITRKLIRDNIKNAPTTSQFGVWFKELMVVAGLKERSEYAKELTTGDVVFPRLAHEAYAASLYGYSESILSKVDKTVTLSRISMSENKLDVVGILMKGEMKYINYLWWRSSTQTKSDVPIKYPASFYIQEARNLGWDAIVEAVTVPYPAQFLRLSFCNPIIPHYRQSGSNYFTVGVSEKVAMNPGAVAENVGESAPYLGSVTKEKLYSRHEVAIFGTEPLMRRPVNLARLIGWVIDMNSNYSLLIKSLISAITDAPIEVFLRNFERPSGSVSHRLNDSALKHGAMYNNLLSPATFLSLSSEYLTDFGKGSTNVNLHFQAALCFIQSITISLIRSKRLILSPIREIHFHFLNPHGLTEVCDNVPDLERPINAALIPSRPNNPYLFVSEDKVKFMQDRFNSMRNSGTILGEGTFSSLEENLKCLIAVDNLSYRIAGKIYKAQADLDEESGMFDIQAIHRFYPNKIHPHEFFLQIYQHLRNFQIRAMYQEDMSSIPVPNKIKRRIIAKVSTVPHQRFVDLVPAIMDPNYKSYLRECMSYSVPLAYPISPHSLTLAAKSCLRNWILKNQDQKFYPMSGFLLDDLSTDPSQYIGNLSMTRARMSQVRCVYCAQSIFRYPMSFREIDTVVENIICRIGHYTGVMYKDLFYWGILKMSLDTVMKELPLIDPVPGVTDKSEEILKFQANRCVIWAKTNRTLWSDTPAIVMGDFPHNDRIHSLYNKIGRHKVPTNGYIRVSEVVQIYLSEIAVREFPSKTLVLGDGFGYSSAAAQRALHGEITAWSYINVDESCPHMLQNAIPPAHEILRVTGEINSSPSRTLESNICTRTWFSSYRLLFPDQPPDLVISEIELFYVNDDPESYDNYLLNILSTNAKGVIIRAKYFPYQQLYNFLSGLSGKYDQCKLVEGATKSGGTNDVWILCYQVSARLSSRHLDIREVSPLFDSMTERIEMGFYGSNPTQEYINMIDNLTWTPDLTVFYEDYVNGWFQSGGLTKWEDNNLSELWYEIMVSRRPISIEDVTGKSVNYLFPSIARKLKERLIVLALIRCSEDVYLTEVDAVGEWQLLWVKTKIGAKNPALNWSVILRRRGSYIPRGLLTVEPDKGEATFNEILKVVPYLRWAKKITRFRQVGNIIRFKYVPSLLQNPQSQGRSEDLWDDPDPEHDWEPAESDFLAPESEWGQPDIEENLCFPVSKRINYYSSLGYLR